MNETRPVHLRTRLVESYPPKRFSQLQLIAALLAGCALGIGVISGYEHWTYKAKSPASSQSRDGWNRSAIEATFHHEVTIQQSSKLFYTLRNNTVQDYTLNGDCAPTVFVVVGANKNLTAVPDFISKTITLSLPLFVPAKHEVIYEVVNLDGFSISTDDILRRNIAGFEILDRKNKFEIFLPVANVPKK